MEYCPGIGSICVLYIQIYMIYRSTDKAGKVFLILGHHVDPIQLDFRALLTNADVLLEFLCVYRACICFYVLIKEGSQMHVKVQFFVGATLGNMLDTCAG